MAGGVEPVSSRAWWLKENFVDDLLARQLCKGSVALIVGAGASAGFGLPSWETLVKRMCEKKGIPWPEKNVNLPLLSDEIRRKHFARAPEEFSRFVHENLYADFRADAATILKSPLLQALGAFLVASIRGRATEVISFNFDDLIEKYLQALGFVTRSVADAPFMDVNADAHILHPHGILPAGRIADSTDLVFTETDFDRVVGKTEDSWNLVMGRVMSASTCIFLGLSGDDARLRSLMTNVKDKHAATRAPYRHAFWGVRPCLKSEADSNKERWAALGVAPRNIRSYDDLPSWLLSICQKAADIRMAA